MRADLPGHEQSPDLFGTWLIEDITDASGAAQARYTDMIVLVGNRQLEIISQCVPIGPFDYQRGAESRLTVRQPTMRPSPPLRPGEPMSPPVVQCARALSPAERAVPRVLFGAERVGEGADGRVSVTGSGGTITLRRTPGALANPYGNHPAPPVPPVVGVWRVSTVDGRPRPGERIEMLFRRAAVEWRSGCLNETRPVTRDRDRLVPGPIDPVSVCERMGSEAERAVASLTAAPFTARTRRDGRLFLAGSGVTVELMPLTD